LELLAKLLIYEVQHIFVDEMSYSKFPTEVKEFGKGVWGESLNN